MNLPPMSYKTARSQAVVCDLYVENRVPVNVTFHGVTGKGECLLAIDRRARDKLPSLR